MDPSCRFPYESNNSTARFIQYDVDRLSVTDLESLFGEGTEPRLLAGCAPCQPFSTYGRPGRSEGALHDWQLVRSFARLVKEVRPGLVTLENVPQLVDHPVFGDLLMAMAEYHVWWDILECEKYGVPQTRRRLVLLGSVYGPLSLPDPSSDRWPSRTVRNAIGHLPELSAGGVDETDRVHAASRLSELNLKRIRASKPGGTWRDWEEALRGECHQRQSGATFPSVYGRMSWDRPAPTITTQCFGYGNGRFGHPEQDRAISLREAALLQTFPQAYQFVQSGEPVRFSSIGRLIGNAVPVQIGRVIGETLAKHINDWMGC